jgi:hypothetical protein
MFGIIRVMSTQLPPTVGRLAPYGSAKDLPSFQETSKLVQSGKLLTLVVARDQRQKILEIEQGLNRLANVVDDFYGRLGTRNWIFHDQLNVDKVEALLAETRDPAAAEERLIEIYRDAEAAKWWTLRLQPHEGLRKRLHQIHRAREHYEANQFDSCVLQLIAVMDGFVNDFEPGVRRGLTSRDPDDMTAWDSVVGHHMGLTHVMKTFSKTIKKRIDHEVFEVYRHGIVHGAVVSFDNVIVATKAWNMLFAVADWATATQKAAEPRKPEPSWSETWSIIKRNAADERYEKKFVASTLTASDPRFQDNEVILRATEFLDAWRNGRWALVSAFTPPRLLGSRSAGDAARHTKEVFGQHDLTNWEITSVTFAQANTADLRANATVNGDSSEMRFRLVLRTEDGNVAMPTDLGARWTLAVWAPHTFFASAS